MDAAQSQSSSNSSQQVSQPSEMDLWISTVGGKKKGRVYGLGLESTTLSVPSQFQGQYSSANQMLQSPEFQAEVRKQVEIEVDARIKATEQERGEEHRRTDEEHRRVQTGLSDRIVAVEEERDEFKKRLEQNERMLRDVLARLNYHPPPTQDFSIHHSLDTHIDPYQRYQGQGDHQSGVGEHDEDDDEEEEEGD